jgi:hypothetical protein
LVEVLVASSLFPLVALVKKTGQDADSSGANGPDFLRDLAARSVM